MNINVISGKLLKNAIISGANSITNQKNKVDEMNVFPVPDGDTGTNMSATIKSALAELSLLSDEEIPAGVVAETAASAMLRGARGNSGVILSLLFRGLAKGLSGKHVATAKEYCNAVQMGVDAAYKSVMKPTEGTILTVARESAEVALKKAEQGGDVADIFGALVTAAESSLETTPELLPVLKKAGVVDAGGMGYLVILKGMSQVISGGEVVQILAKTETSEPIKTTQNTNAAGNFDADIEFTYCTEYIVIKSHDAKDSAGLRAYLETIGDSAVVVDGGDIIKVHVHTENPGKALEEGLLFGALTNMKIENMREQHKQETVKAGMQKKRALEPQKPENNYGFVAVASGAGVENLFKDLGVDNIVRGGQTQNPSTEDILEAVLATPAKNVFVLPNNKNIIMTAEQATKLAKDRKVIVLQSRSIPQGLSAMLCFDESLSLSENSVAMTKALDRVGTGAVTYAARDSVFEGRKIKSGDIMALENGRLAFTEKETAKALAKLVRKMLKGDTTYVTVMYGESVSEHDAESAYALLREKVSENIEIVLINGGQPVYYYLVSVE